MPYVLPPALEEGRWAYVAPGALVDVELSPYGKVSFEKALGGTGESDEAFEPSPSCCPIDRSVWRDPKTVSLGIVME